MSINIDELKRMNLIEDVVAEVTGYPLEGRGKHLSPRSGTKEGGLVVNVDEQIYFWNIHNRGGDVIRFLENEKGLDFRGACEFLAKRAGIPLHMDEVQAARIKAARVQSDLLTVLVEFLHGKYLSSTAEDYVEGRGISAEVATEHQLGYWMWGFKAELLNFCKVRGIDPTHPAFVSFLGFSGDVRAWLDKWKLKDSNAEQWIAKGRVPGAPENLLIYPHWVGGRVEYLAGRRLDWEKGCGFGKSWNLRVSFVGDKQPMWNKRVTRQSVSVVVVEGQMDALTLAQWNVPAVALAGGHSTPALIKQLQGFDRVFVALDADAPGQAHVAEIASEIGPECQIVSWPKQVDADKPAITDANDWMRYGGGSAEAVSMLLGGAPIFALWLCQRVGEVDPLQREEALNKAVHMVARLKPYAYERYNKSLVNALPSDIGKRELTNMVKALQKDGTAVRLELTMPNGYVDGHLFEMVYDGEHPDGPRTAFAVRYPDGRIGITKILETENYRITPLSPLDTVLDRGFIKLASDPHEYGSETALLEEIRAFIHKYVDIPADMEMMAAYYIMMTWLFDKFYVIPYLRARGDSDSGKSRFTETVGYLAFRSIMINGATTPSPVFRLMSLWNGLTVVMDEADLPHAETSTDWTMMLNTGYKNEGGILRTNISNGEATIDAFTAFGPKIVNMRGKFPDDATESRCLTWETASGRGIRADIPRYMDREAFKAEALAIRNKLLKWRLRSWQDVETDYNHERTKHLPGRLVEITVSLMSISQDEEFKESIFAFVERMNDKAIMSRQGTLVGKVLMGLLKAYFDPDEKILDAPDGQQEELKLAVSHITRQVNRIINLENLEASVADSMEGMREIKSTTVGKIVNTELNLETRRGKYGTRGSTVVWDVDRINALIERYGMAEDVMKFTEDGMKRAEARAKREAEKGKSIDL